MFEWTLTSVLTAAAIGGFVGFLSGVFGVGGGFLLVPILNATLGIPMPLAVGSTACYTLGPATTAMLVRKPKAGYVELPLILAGGLFAGVWSGTLVLSRLTTAATVEIMGHHVPAVDLMVLSSYAVLMIAIAIMSLRDVLRPARSSSVQRRGLLAFVPLPPIAQIPDLRPGVYSIPLLVWTGLVVGFLSGFLGMSGGLILVPAAIYLLGLRVHDATTVSIVIVWMASLQSTLMHALHANIELELVISLLICGTVGAGLGAQLGMKLKGRQLKLGFAALVLVAAGIVFAKLWSLWNQTAVTP